MGKMYCIFCTEICPALETLWINKADTLRKSGGVLVHQYYDDLRACLPAQPSGVSSNLIFFFQYIRKGRQREDDGN